MSTLFESQAKFIIFAHHIMVLDSIEKLVTETFKKESIRIDGSVRSEDRMTRVNQFQN